VSQRVANAIARVRRRAYDSWSQNWWHRSERCPATADSGTGDGKTFERKRSYSYKIAGESS